MSSLLEVWGLSFRGGPVRGRADYRWKRTRRKVRCREIG